MLSRLAKKRGEEGFTLIELLVVIIIIGILAAIAIPVFLNQRKKGWESAVKADLRNAATAQETWLTDNGEYSDQTPAAGGDVAGNELGTVGFKYSPGTNYDGGNAAITVVAHGATDYCLQATPNEGLPWSYSSPAGLTNNPC
jgi:type IV pilus assembly protein PilA